MEGVIHSRIHRWLKPFWFAVQLVWLQTCMYRIAYIGIFQSAVDPTLRYIATRGRLDCLLRDAQGMLGEACKDLGGPGAQYRYLDFYACELCDGFHSLVGTKYFAW